MKIFRWVSWPQGCIGVLTTILVSEKIIHSDGTQDTPDTSRPLACICACPRQFSVQMRMGPVWIFPQIDVFFSVYLSDDVQHCAMHYYPIFASWQHIYEAIMLSTNQFTQLGQWSHDITHMYSRDEYHHCLLIWSLYTHCCHFHFSAVKLKMNLAREVIC